MQRELGSRGTNPTTPMDSLLCCLEQGLRCFGQLNPSNSISVPWSLCWALCSIQARAHHCQPGFSVQFSRLQSSSHHRSQGTSGSFGALVPLRPLLPWGSHLAELPLVAFAALQSKGTDISAGKNSFCRKTSETSDEREKHRL